MGASNSKTAGSELTKEQAAAYLNHLVDTQSTAPFRGSAHCVTGGADAMAEEYDASVASKSKKEMIRRLAAGISKVLGATAPGPDASVEALLKHLVKITPNPRKGTRITANVAKQSKLCRDMADVVNKVYGKVVDVQLSPDEICNQVAELVESLSIGFRKEFTAVSASIERSLQNLKELKSLLTRSYGKLHESAMSSTDGSLKLKVDGIKRIHDFIMAEVERQLAVLSNLTNTQLRGTERDVAMLLAQNEDFKGLVQNIKSAVGTSQWGEKLGYWLSGINNTAQIAGIVDKARSAIGMSLANYKKASKMSELMQQTQAILEKVPADKLTREYLDLHTRAVALLKKYHRHHSEVVKHVEAKGGREPLAKKIKKHQQTRILLMRDFKLKMKHLMRQLHGAIARAARAVGSGKIPLTDDLLRFKNVLAELTLVFNEGIEYALTGYDTHANAVQHKDRFLGLLQSLADSLAPLTKDVFRDIKASIAQIVKVIDFYSDSFRVHTGKKAAVTGGGSFEATTTLRQAKALFEHAHNTAKFRQNLKAAAKEMKTYDKKYAHIVGTAVGKKIDEIRTDVKTKIENLTKSDEKDPSGLKEALELAKSADVHTKIALGHNSNKGLVGLGKGEWSPEHIAACIKAHGQAKEKLYQVAQAVDEYLQKFTDAVAVTPDDVAEVSKILSSVNIMASWFTDRTGDSVASLYEMFPWAMDGARAYVNESLRTATSGKDGSRVTIPESTHYYSTVSENINDAKQVNGMGDMENAPGLPGNPFLPISPLRAAIAHKFAKYTVDKLYVLKNIVSAFAYLGRKFGDQDLSKSTFMSPSEMYKCLTEYVYMSALTMGWGGSHQPRVYGQKMDGSEYAPSVKSAVQHPTVTATSNLGDAGDIKIAPYSSFDKMGDDGKGGIVSIDPGAAKDAWVGTPQEKADFARIAKLRWTHSFAMSGIEESQSAATGVSLSGWSSCFFEEDKVFVNIIKAMSAKVFTVTGLYNMMNFGDGMHSYALSPTRLILGGSERHSAYETPKIFPGAVELYARLPLLAEFYRDIFCFEEACDDQTREPDQLLISMVPEVGSVWVEFITAIFDQPAGTTVYTNNALKRIVHAINSVYVMHKNKTNPVQEVISDFVNEINSRYGLMNRKEISDYTTQETKRRMQSTYGQEEEDMDFDILDEDDTGIGHAPSDRFTQVGNPVDKVKYSLDKNSYDALKTLRRRIDKRVLDVLAKTADPVDKGDYVSSVPDFSAIILSVKDSLKATTDVSDRFSTVSKMMTTMDITAHSNQEASVMFHETVVAPLAVLTSITNMLSNYQEQTCKWDAPALFRTLRRGFESKYFLADDVHVELAAKLDAALRDTMKQHGDLSGSVADNLLRQADQKWVPGFMGCNVLDAKALVALYARVNDVAQNPAVQENGVDVEVLPKGWTYACHLAYILVRWESLFKKLTSIVSGLDDLFDLQFANGKLTVNHSKLQMLCEEVFASVRKYFTKFRGVISDKKLRQYEDHSTHGTIGWIQKTLFDGLFNNADKRTGLNYANKIITESYLLLANKDIDDLSKHVTYFDLSGQQVVQKERLRTQGWCVNGVLAEMTHYNSLVMTKEDKTATDPAGAVGVLEAPIPSFASEKYLDGALTRDDPWSHLMMMSDTKNRQRIEDPRFVARHDYYLQKPGFRGDTHVDQLNGVTKYRTVHDANGEVSTNNVWKIDNGMGLMMKFNEIMASYLAMFWDPTTLKIYSPLVERPANGPLNRSVFKAQGWPDLASAVPLSDLELARQLADDLDDDIDTPATHAEFKTLLDKKETKLMPNIVVDIDVGRMQNVAKTTLVPSSLESFSILLKNSMGTLSEIAGSVDGSKSGQLVKRAIDCQTKWLELIGDTGDMDTKIAVAVATSLPARCVGKAYDVPTITEIRTAISQLTLSSANLGEFVDRLYSDAKGSLSDAMKTHDSNISQNDLDLIDKIDQATFRSIASANAATADGTGLTKMNVFIHALRELTTLKSTLVKSLATDFDEWKQSAREILHSIGTDAYEQDEYTRIKLQLTHNHRARLTAVGKGIGLSYVPPNVGELKQCREKASEHAALMSSILDVVKASILSMIGSATKYDIVAFLNLSCESLTADAKSLSQEYINLNTTIQNLPIRRDIDSALGFGEWVFHYYNSTLMHLAPHRSLLPLFTDDVNLSDPLFARFTSDLRTFASPGISAYAGAGIQIPDRASPHAIITTSAPIKFKNWGAGFKKALNLASAHASASFTSTQISPDDIAESGSKGDPTEILFASLSKALRSALTDTDSRGQKINVITSITEVPGRQKEVMKAHLPTFANLFSAVSRKADILKNMAKLGLGLEREGWNVRGEIPVPGVHGGVLDTSDKSQEEAHRWFIELLDKISNSSEAMITTINDVLNELNDAPLYLETHEDSISEFKNRNARDQFMPLSSMTVLLKPAVANGADKTWGREFPRRPANLCYPDSSVGDRSFMFSYGTRGLLSDTSVRPLIEHMPGVANILKLYNLTASQPKRFETKTYGGFASRVTELLRYVHCTKVYGLLTGADRCVFDDSAKDSKIIPTYQMTESLGSAIELTTNSDVDGSQSTVAAFIDDVSRDGKASRSSSWIYNLLDLNISPINIHAMRREIPLVNLYNYAYTFDSFVTQIVKSSCEGSDSLKDNAHVSTHDVLSALCKNPYIRIPVDTFHGKLRDLISGRSTIDSHGYPKFISDQLWNKALLQQPVRSAGFQRRNDEFPAAGQAPADADSLQYLKEGKVVEKDSHGMRGYLAELGRLRFDTKFARNLMFLANIQRLITGKINTELTRITHPVVSSTAVVNRKITNYTDGETHPGLDLE